LPSARMQPREAIDDLGSNRTGQRRAPERERHTYLVTIAGRWLGLSAFFNLVWGFGALISPHIAHAHYMFGILHTSGWISILLGVLQLAVAAGAVMGNQLARWLGVALLMLNAINQKYFIGTYPVWSSLIIFFDVISIFALVRYGTRQNLAISRRESRAW
jgi:hypothetical protein